MWSLDERKRLVARQVADVTSGECQETFTLRLASGRQLEATADSQFMTLDGWRRLDGLKVGDRIAVPRRVPEPSRTQRMADEELVLLAHMIGDGSCVKNQPTRYASIDEQNLAAVANAAKHFGVTALRRAFPSSRADRSEPLRGEHNAQNPFKRR